MAVLGVLVEKGRVKGVKAKVAKNGTTVEQDFENRLENFNSAGAIVGIPFKEFFVKSVTVPGVEKNEIANTVSVQTDFLLPYDPASAMVSRPYEHLQNELRLMIISTPKKELRKPKAVFPAPIALYSLAMNEGLLLPGKSTLIIRIDDGEVTTIAVEGEEIVFIRSFPKDDNFTMDLKLSAQAVYLKSERALLEIDRVVLFDEDDTYGDELKSIFSSEILIVKPSKLFTGGLNSVTASKMLIPAGLAVSRKYLKKLKNWNVNRSDVPYGKLALRWGAIGVPVLIVLITALFHFDSMHKESRLKDVKAVIDTIRPAWREVREIEGEVTAMEDFLNNSGADLLSPEAWFNTIDALDDARPYGLWFTNISGKTYGSVIVSGKSHSYDSVTEFMNKLYEKPGLSNLNLLFTQGSPEKGVNFQISLTMKQLLQQ